MTGKPETVYVPHLGGSTISYKLGKPYDRRFRRSS